jgi:hypothetical protein
MVLNGPRTILPFSSLILFCECQLSHAFVGFVFLVIYGVGMLAPLPELIEFLAELYTQHRRNNLLH